jgi:DNA-binding GntR family transcriptional regulator
MYMQVEEEGSELVTKDGKLQRRTMSEEIAQNLRDEIQRGALKPGTRLKQGEVSVRLGVSTTPVREAFALLQAGGFVTVDPYKGAIVFRPSIREVRELYEIRVVLEALAIEHAITNLTGGDLLKLQQIIDRMRDTNDDEQWLALNHDFHQGIYNKSERPRLCSLSRPCATLRVHTYTCSSLTRIGAERTMNTSKYRMPTKRGTANGHVRP